MISDFREAGVGFQKYYFLDSFGFFWILLDTLQFFLILLDTFRFFWILFNSFEFFWILLHSLGVFWIFLESIQKFWILSLQAVFAGCLCRQSLQALFAVEYFGIIQSSLVGLGLQLLRVTQQFLGYLGRLGSREYLEPCLSLMRVLLEFGSYSRAGLF